MTSDRSLRLWFLFQRMGLLYLPNLQNLLSKHVHLGFEI
jgi:hypothetical protein